MKWIGAALIFLGCGWVGFSLAQAHRNEERSLQQLLGALDYMQCELQYRLTPLPDLCRQTARQATGNIQTLLLKLAQELEDQIQPDVCRCMSSALAQVPKLPSRAAEGAKILGKTLGRFDLEGQLTALEGARQFCRNQLEQLSNNREQRLRSYQTLGLCAGAAIAILFL